MRCAVIQTAFLGDVILTVPLLLLLRSDESVSEIAVLSSPPGAGFLEGQSIADRVLTYDKRGSDRGASGLARVIGELRAFAADAVLVPHRSFRSAYIAWAARVPRRVGFDASGGRLLLTERLPYESGTHEVERVASLASALGIRRPDGRLPFELRVPEGEHEALTGALAAASPTGGSAGGVDVGEGYIVVAPGSRWATKQWLPERFALAARELSNETGAGIVVTGSVDEREVGAAVARAAGPATVDMTGSLPLGRLLALVSRARLVLSNDSAVAHVAAGLGTPVVSVFGPTVPAQGFSPYADAACVVEAELSCRPCGRHGGDRCPIGTLECMERVSAGDVVSSALELLGRGGTGA